MEEENARTLNALVKAGFIAQQTTISAWCRDNGLKPENARKSLLGSWHGPKALVWKRRLMVAARVAELSSFAVESNTARDC